MVWTDHKRGLTVDEWKEVRNNTTELIEDGIVSLAPLGGLTSNVIAHLRSEWITWLDDRVEITVPEKSDCNDFKSTSGRSSTIPLLEERQEPCNYCKSHGETNGFEPHFYGTDSRLKKTILHREVAAPAVEFLEIMFKTDGRKEMSMTQSSIAKKAKALTSGAKIEGSGFNSLLRTGPVIYDHYGLHIEEIAKLTPYSENSILQILRATKCHGENPAQHAKPQEILSMVSEHEPVTLEEAANKLDMTKPAISYRFNNFKSEGRMSVENNHPGAPKAVWKTTADSDMQYTCEICGYTGHSQRSISIHKAKAH